MDGDDADEVCAASALFDHETRSDWTRRFFESGTHHLCIAYEDDVAAGFVSGVETTHPDKGTEMFLYELGVEEQFRRRGIGRALVSALATRAAGVGCYGMWVLTDEGNVAAISTYRAAGAAAEGSQVMLGWRFEPVIHEDAPR